MLLKCEMSIGPARKKKESKLKFKEQLTKDKECVGNKQHFTFQFDKAA